MAPESLDEEDLLRKRTIAYLHINLIMLNMLPWKRIKQ